jgi:Protein of unknown function (DUF3311)
LGPRAKRGALIWEVGVAATSSDKRGGSWLWYLLLVLPFIATLWVPFYNSIEPQWNGIPFFYWYLFLWIFISAALTLVVYFATNGKN